MMHHKVYVLLLVIFGYSCQINEKEIASTPANLFQQHCGSCHLVPDPAHLTKDIWANSVLPRMGWRLGIQTPGKDPYAGMDSTEVELLKKNSIYPEQQMIAEEDWAKLQEFILGQAPEEIPLDQERLTRNKPCSQFTRKNFHVDQLFGASITAIEFDATKKELWIADFNNNVYHWTKSGNRSFELESPVVDFHFSAAGTLMTQIGKLFPTEKKLGTISLFDGKQKTDLLLNVHRPVHAEFHDLNQNGQAELIVAKYGNKTGGLSIFEKKGEAYVEREIIPLPGAIKFYIQDLNGDDVLDIAALFAQGDEAVYYLLQKADLNFKVEKKMRFPAEYGTSDFALFDYDQDGDLDLATVHGDNADFSYILKPHHGLRLHINTNDVFQEKFFYPLYGATKVQVDDFDGDGDYDFAISAFFPEFDQLLEEHLVYLENKAYQDFRFQSQTFKSGTPFRSLTLEKADFDGDGDQDLITGLFMNSPQSIPEALSQEWKKEKFDIAVFVNIGSRIGNNKQ